MADDPSPAVRLAHGYTNDTTAEGDVVVKRYAGPDAGDRAAREQYALATLASWILVPGLVASGPAVTRTRFVTGRHGQELLDEGHADRVLRLCGGLAARLAAVDPRSLPGLGVPRPGQVVVHGDFGPQNVLVDVGRWEIAALLDWELTGFDDPVRDVAWAEWIVRTHHPALTDHLDALFDGFGDRPRWRDRQRLMVAACRRAYAFVARWESPNQTAALRMWRRRLDATEAFCE